MKPFLPAPSFLFLVIAEERGLCAGFVCKAANLRARRQQSTARPRPRPVGFATWKFDVGISRGYFIYLFIYFEWRNSAFWRQKVKKPVRLIQRIFGENFGSKSPDLDKTNLKAPYLQKKVPASRSPKNSEIARF